MKLELFKIEKLVKELEDLMHQPVDGMIKFKFRTMLRTLIPLVEDLRKTRDEIIVKFGEEDKETKNFTLMGSEKQNEGIEELNKLFMMKKEVKLEALTKEDFKDVKSEFPYDIVYDLIK